MLPTQAQIINELLDKFAGKPRAFAENNGIDWEAFKTWQREEAPMDVDALMKAGKVNEKSRPLLAKAAEDVSNKVQRSSSVAKLERLRNEEHSRNGHSNGTAQEVPLNTPEGRAVLEEMLTAPADNHSNGTPPDDPRGRTVRLDDPRFEEKMAGIRSVVAENRLTPEPTAAPATAGDIDAARNFLTQSREAADLSDDENQARQARTAGLTERQQLKKERILNAPLSTGEFATRLKDLNTGISQAALEAMESGGQAITADDAAKLGEALALDEAQLAQFQAAVASSEAARAVTPKVAEENNNEQSVSAAIAAGQALKAFRSEVVKERPAGSKLPKHLTGVELANELGINHMILNQMENGLRPIPRDIITHLNKEHPGNDDALANLNAAITAAEKEAGGTSKPSAEQQARINEIRSRSADRQRG